MIDLNTCDAGDILVLKNGKTVEYVGIRTFKTYTHEVRYPNGCEGNRTVNGMFDAGNIDHKFNIASIRKKGKRL